jgi:hypothetical protein
MAKDATMERFKLRYWASRVTAPLAALGVFCCPFSATAAPSPDALKTVSGVRKPDLLARLKSWQDRLNQKVATVDEKIKKRLADSTEVSLAGRSHENPQRKMDVLSAQIDDLTKERQEVLAEREVVDRMIFAVDSKWSDQPLTTFFETQFLDMAANDLNEENPSKIWKVLTFMSVAAREIPENREDVVSVLEGYLNFSSALNPKSPSVYASNRNYSNGSESVAAKSVPRDSVGDGLVIRLQTSGKPAKIQPATTAKTPTEAAVTNQKTDQKRN